MSSNKEIVMSKTPLRFVAPLLLISACAPPSPGDEAPRTEQKLKRTAVAPSEIGFVEKVEYQGTGCGGGSATTAISPDNLAVTSVFSEFLAAIGPGNDPGEGAKNCLLMMQIKVPAGLQYSLESVDYRGFAQLDEGVTGTRRSVYVISGSPIQATPTARFTGPTEGDYTQEDVGPDARGEWSPCGGGQVLWIAAQTELDGHGHRDAAGVLSVDSIDTELQWRRCQ
jgi:hypothetical protein